MSHIKREIKKHTDLTIDEVKAYLTKFREYIMNDRYSISLNKNRRENIEFIENYKIDTKKEKEILLSIQYDDFCYAVDNYDDRFPQEILYIFCKTQELDNWGTLENVDIYIKINITKIKNGDDFVFIVSFHRRNKKIEYLFK